MRDRRFGRFAGQNLAEINHHDFEQRQIGQGPRWPIAGCFVYCLPAAGAFGCCLQRSATGELAAPMVDAVVAQLEDGFLRCPRVIRTGGDGMGFQLAMVLTNDRTSGLSPMRGKCLRSSTTPASSPPSS